MSAAAPYNAAPAPGPALADFLPAPAARSPLLALILSWLAPCYRPPRPTQSVWRWADAHVFLDGKATPRPGFYRSAETPWVRRFTDIFIDPVLRECLVLKSSRTGFTEAALNVVRYMPEHAPGQVLIALDSKKEAQNISNDRLGPSLRDVAASQMSDDPDDDGTLTKRLLNMTVLLSGSYSAGFFRNKWARLIVLDEIEVNPEIPGEGPTLDLARSRFTGVEGGRLLAMSKPKRHGSVFHRQWAAGTCEIFLAPCPHCGTWQEFTWDGTSATEELHIPEVHVNGRPQKITAPLTAKPPPLGRIVTDHCRDLFGAYDLARVVRETYYQCVSGCRITEADKPRILAQINREGEHWLRTNPAPVPGRCSQHIGDLLSPYAEVSWGELAKTWHSCTTQSEIDHFRNNHLGIPARDKARAIALTAVLDCRNPGYRRGELPFIPDDITLNWDTQDDLLHWGICAHRLVPGKDLPEIAVIDFGRILQPAELSLLLQQQFPLAHSVTLPTSALGQPLPAYAALFGLGDAGGHRTAEIYEVCFQSGGRLFPAYGRGRASMMHPLRETAFKHGQREVTGYLFSDDQFKRRLYFDLIGRIPEIRQELAARPPEHRAAPICRLHLPADIMDTRDGAEFVEGLAKERTIETQTKRGLVVEWDENVRGNESGDIVKQALVQFEFRRPTLQRASQLRAQQEAAAAAAKKAA